MIAETLAGIALFKSAVDGIKSAIGTANDVSEIAGFIDNLFEGEQQIQKKRSAKSGVSVADQFGVKSVASEIIDAKLAKEQMYEVAQMVDLRFGSGTWKSIVEERARRIQEHKEAQKQARIDKRKANAELWSEVKQVLLVAGLIFAGLAIIVGSVWYSRLS